MTGRLVLVLAALLVSPPALSARTWHINPDGTGDAPTIQAGIDSAAVGDTVALSAGEFHEVDLEIPSGMTILGVTEQTVLDQGLAGSGFSATGVPFLTLQGLIVRNADRFGASITGETETATLVVRDCVFEGTQGNGLRFDNIQGAVDRCTFRDNVAGGGAGIWAGQSGATALIESSLFTGNTAAGGAGAGIFGGSVVVRDCVFRDNVGRYGVAAWGFDLRLHGSVFENNQMGFVGQGGAARGVDYLFVDECWFLNNGGLCEGSTGGALRASGVGEIHDSVFYGNFAVNGSAIYSLGPITVSGCLFQENTAGSDVAPCSGNGAIYLNGRSGSRLIRQSTFIGNLGRNISGVASQDEAPVEVDRCVFHAGRGLAIGWVSPQARCPQVACTNSFGNVDRFGNNADWIGCVSGQSSINGNFSADPLLCDADAGDYHLQWGSPCLPANSPEGCGLIGAFGFGGCNSVSVTPESWARVKARYR
ncbi:MAG: hypothetical protein DHS20C21_04020 [Gemmatimonadota bacterium]|nr:MAG: hypothetical protein DHS20C21_04020 [Gemmatimonadota bacterium]